MFVRFIHLFVCCCYYLCLLLYSFHHMNTTIYVSIFLWLEICIIEYFQFFVITRRKTMQLSNASFRARVSTLLLDEFLRERLLQPKTYVCSALTDADGQFSKMVLSVCIPHAMYWSSCSCCTHYNPQNSSLTQLLFYF